MTYPLTSRGVSELLENLYSLPDSDLKLQAIEIKTNFRSWVEKNFSLSQGQINYLNSLPDDSVQYFGDQCWFCFIHRLNITLDYPSAPTQTRVGKWTGGTSSTKLITNDSGNQEASGGFSFDMTYREL